MDSANNVYVHMYVVYQIYFALDFVSNESPPLNLFLLSRGKASHPKQIVDVPMYPSCPSVWQPSPAADKRVDVGVLVTVVGGVDISVVVIVVEEVL